jgi:hypothetical protein
MFFIDQFYFIFKEKLALKKLNVFFLNLKNFFF